MKKKIALMVAFGCLGASAASVNYDILGRKGSKMNSPMVYKNVDYSKAKKNEQQKVGSSLETRALHRTGMPDDVAAIEGSFRSYQSNNRFSIKRHYYGNPDNCNNSQCTYEWNGYKSRANSVFIPVNEYNGEIPNYETESAVTHSTDNGAYSFSWQLTNYLINTNTTVTYPSPFKAGQNIKYLSRSRMRALSGLAYSTVSYQHFSNVGIYMSADALPVSMDGYDIKYVKTNTNETFISSNPVKEMETYKPFHILRQTGIYDPVIYVGRKVDYGNPASKVPQVYMGVRIKNMSKGPSDYSLVAKNLDNFIYKYRTVEFVPAGNYGVDGTNSQGKLNAEGRAANAITVGAVDPSSGEITNYTSTKNYNLGSQKPEIFNYSHIVLTESGHGVERIYTKKSNNTTSIYYPVADGTEAATAYTADMVFDLLSLNPFYRWHPEIVKAFLLTAGGNPINSGNVFQKIPTSQYLLFDYSGTNPYNYDSRYWNGSIDNLKTRTNSSEKKEIWFVTKNLGTSTKPASAAISWLSSGNDIENIGRIPQDFDLSVYGSNSSNYEKYTAPHAKLDGLNFDNPGEYIDGSFSTYNSYEKVTIASNYKYLIFRIQMFSDDDRSENKGQVVIGFNMAAAK